MPLVMCESIGVLNQSVYSKVDGQANMFHRNVQSRPQRIIKPYQLPHPLCARDALLYDDLRTTRS